MQTPQRSTASRPTPTADAADAAVLVVALGAFIDAGHTQGVLGGHLLETAPRARRRVLRHRPAARLPRPPPGHGLRPQPVGRVRRPVDAAAPAHRPRRADVPAAHRPGARLPVGAGRPGDPRAGAPVRHSAHGQRARHPDGRAAHPPARHDRPRHQPAPHRGLRAGVRPGAGARQHLLPSRAAPRRGRARRHGLRGPRAALPRPGRVCRRARSPGSTPSSTSPG